MNSSKINYGIRLLDSKRVFFIVRYIEVEGNTTFYVDTPPHRN